MDAGSATHESDDPTPVARRESLPHDQPASFASRLITRPKLHHQISLMITRSMGSDGLPAPIPTSALEEELKVQRYERMMDHFQLRHVPLARTASTTATPSTRHDGWSTREPLTRTPNRHHSSTAVGMEMARENPRRLRGTVYAVNSDPELPTTTHYGMLKAAPSRFSFSTSNWTSLPWSPTSLPTRVRLILLMLVFAVQLVYMPYGIVYYPPNQTATIVLDSMADVAFLLNIFATCVTEVYSGKGPPNTSLRAIRRSYWKRGLAMDVLAAAPFEFPLSFRHAPWLRWGVRIAHVCVQYMSLLRHVNRFHRAWKREVTRVDKSLIAWVLYSRYGHLVRIGGIVCLVMIMAHYFACVWSSLQAAVDATFLTSRDPFEIHMHSIYDALQLLQGQGLPISTPAQALFGSFAVLLGSIALAVIFGHVAILVSNFSANQTSYQRKMERVFAIMGKLQLPHPIRERIHQYYEYLHAEYESLDGEIVKFAKELSHTLELEVVLFKYMDVLMHVPHWRECSPDFQKQLVLNLGVRVYLPDDFIMRRGEVGTECYIINRGTCKQHEYPSGNNEPPTLPMVSDERETQSSRTRGRHSSQTFSRRFSQTSSATASIRVRDQTQTKFNSRYSMPESARSDQVDLGPYRKVTVLRRGQAIGDIALIANYERSSDVRAVSYVEMCVIERDTFQRILTRYPHDREIVLNSIVHHTMLHRAADHVPCMLMQMVRDVVPTATVTTGIKLMARAMNPRENDPTIVFGVTEQLKTRLQALAPRPTEDDLADSHFGLGGSEPRVDANEEHSGRNAAVTNPHSRNRGDEHSSISSAAESELYRMAREMQAQLARIEERQLSDYNTTSRHNSRSTLAASRVNSQRSVAASRHNSQSALGASHPNQSTSSAATLIRVPPVIVRSKSRHRLLRGQSVKTGVGVRPQQPAVSNWSNRETMAPLTLPLNGDALVQGSAVVPDTTTPFSAPKRILQDLVGTLWSKPTEVAQDQSLTPCADQLFQSRRQSPNGNPLNANPLTYKCRRGSSGILEVQTYHQVQLREDHRRSSLQRLQP